MPTSLTRDLPHDALPVAVVADRLQGVLVAAVAAVAAARPGELAHPRPAWARAGLQTVGEELERCVIKDIRDMYMYISYGIIQK